MQKFINCKIETTFDNSEIIEKAIYKGDTLNLNIKIFNTGALTDLTNEIVDIILKKIRWNTIRRKAKNNSKWYCFNCFWATINTF